MHLRIYMGIMLIILVTIAFTFLGFENYRRAKEIKELEFFIQRKLEDSEKTIIRPLPVCHKNESNSKCRPLAADETGSTVRGNRDEIQDN